MPPASAEAINPYNNWLKTKRLFKLFETNRGTQGFFPCSEFAVYKKVLAKPEPLAFPDYTFLSRNYYNKVGHVFMFALS
jgi:hypothetical protein